MNGMKHRRRLRRTPAMGNISTIILAAPHADYSADKAVRGGLADLGFSPVPDQTSDGSVFFAMVEHKISHHGGVDGLKEKVLALPWHRWQAPSHLQVLWEDDYTHEDDSMAGRQEPYAWNHETWVLP